MRAKASERNVKCGDVVDAKGYKVEDDTAFASTRQSSSPQPSTSSQPSTSRKRKAPSDDEEEEGDEEQVQVSLKDKKKIEFFDKFIPAAMKLAGVPTIHVARGDKECTICKKKYRRTSMLRAHVQKAHLGQGGKHKCTQCTKTYIEKSMLESHIALVHEGKGHECDTCHKKFVTAKSLENHTPQHDPSGNWECPHDGCIQVFKLERYMKEHRQHCVFNLNRREYPCNLCTKVFYQRKQLNRHQDKAH